MGRIASTAVCLVGLASAILGMAASFGGTVEPGVVADNPGGRVRQVVPGGFAWRDGVRAGQLVVSLTAADDPNGWAIETRDGGEIIRSGIAPQGRLLELLRPVAVGAVALAGFGLLILRKSHREGEGLAAMAVVLASLPISIQGATGGSLLVLSLAAFLPVTWLARRIRNRRLSAAVWAAGGGLAVGWLALRLLGDPAVGRLDDLRGTAAAVGAVLIAATLIGGLPRVRVRALGRPRLLDLISLGTLVVLLVLLLLANAPPFLIASVVALSVAGYPGFRRTLLRLLDRVLLAELRERTTIAAGEAERAKLARDLHDVPLQELAGVIKRLESVPEARTEEEALRGIAEQLRGITVELHPPVLEDLGLAAAIDFLVSQGPYRTAHAELVVAISDHAGLSRTERPPDEVELTIFRIVQEAITNALRHSGASAIRIEGRVTAQQIGLAVRDNGTGIDPDSEERALRAGRLGLASMRRRADSIGADLQVDSTLARGTRITVDWEA